VHPRASKPVESPFAALRLANFTAGVVVFSFLGRRFPGWSVGVGAALPLEGSGAERKSQSSFRPPLSA
jgi:hypothetical protein